MPEVGGQGEAEREAGEDLRGTPDTAGKGVGECTGVIGNEGAAVGGEGTAEPVCIEAGDRGRA